MKRLVINLYIVCLGQMMWAQNSLSLSFNDAQKLMKQENRSLQISRKNTESAQSEREKIRALWFPSLQASGAYAHFSQPIEVRQSLKPYAESAEEVVQQLLPNNQFITGWLNQLGNQTLSFPLLPQNISSIGVSAEWILFSGGKRVQAGKIGDRLVDIAQEAQAETNANQQILLAERYFGLNLAEAVVQVRQETVGSLRRHYHEAVKLEEAGMIDKASRLLAQVNLEEAERSLEAAQRDTEVLLEALRTLIHEEEGCLIQVTSPLFINRELPDKALFIRMMQTANPAIKQLRLMKDVEQSRLRIAQSAYFPNIALFGKQTLYAHGLPSNLAPRTVIGIGFSWNLFDGLAREQQIRQAKLAGQSLQLGEEKANEEFSVAIDKLYAQLENAQNSVKALKTSILLSEELVRMRRKAFTEGMATSTEVVDAETMLANAQLAKLAAFYEYDVVLMNLLALCGMTETFANYQNNAYETY